MNNDSKLLAEAYKVVRENMPYPVFAKLSKHASPGSHKDGDIDPVKLVKKIMDMGTMDGIKYLKQLKKDMDVMRFSHLLSDIVMNPEEAASEKDYFRILKLHNNPVIRKFKEDYWPQMADQIKYDANKKHEDENTGVVREQGPLAAGFQGMTQGIAPYAAGAVAGAKQLGQNLAGAVTGSQQAPQSPIAAGQQAFTNQQVNQLADNVAQMLGLPQEARFAIINGLSQLGINLKQRYAAMDQNIAAMNARRNQHQQVVNQIKTDTALQQTGQQVTPQMSINPRVNQSTGQLNPGGVRGGQVPASYAYNIMNRGA